MALSGLPMWDPCKIRLQNSYDNGFHMGSPYGTQTNPGCIPYVGGIHISCLCGVIWAAHMNPGCTPHVGPTWAAHKGPILAPIWACYLKVNICFFLQDEV